MRITFSRSVVFFMAIFVIPWILFPGIGVKLGLQRTILSSGDYSFDRMKIGVFYTIKIDNRFSLQSELLYSHIGGRRFFIQYDMPDIDAYLVEYTENLSYIEIPLLVKYTVPLKNGWKPLLFAGGYAAMKLTKNLHFSEGIDWDHPLESSIFWGNLGFDQAIPRPVSFDDIFRPYASVEGGIVLGIGVEHGLGRGKQIFEFRFNIGLSNMYQGPPDYQIRRNNSMSLMVGFAF